jgi:hypothetical protein
MISHVTTDHRRLSGRDVAERLQMKLVLQKPDMHSNALDVGPVHVVLEFNSILDW